MFQRVCLFIALVFILGFTGSAWSQNFSDVIVFGDSLSDSGNAASLQPLPPGTTFTTNPDPVWAEIVADDFGVSSMNSLAGGPNYAFAGACVNPATPCVYDVVPTVTEQIQQYFLKSDGRADPNALYAIWGGANDVANSLFNDPPNAAGLTLAAADVTVEQIRHLQDAGARQIVVYNLPDISKSPFAINLGPVVQRALAQQVTAHNGRLSAGISESEDGIVPINSYAFFNEVVENHESYGFTSATGTACGEPDAATPLSVTCGPQASGYPVTYEDGANRQYLFADRSHPSGAMHELIASMVTSTLAAPVQVSLAGEGGVEMANIHRSAVSAERMTDLGLERSVGSWRAYVTGRIGRYKLDALPRLGETQADVQVFTLGANHRPGTNLWWGAALSFGWYNNDASGASLESSAVIGSVHGTWRRGGFYVSGALSAGSTSVDVRRSITLGPAVRAEQGSTSAGQFGAEFDAGWMLGDPDDLQHGPFLGLAWLNQSIDGYRESGSRSTAMNFSGFDRDSLIARAGYRVTRTLALNRVGLRPYANVAVAKEFKDDPISVTAGSKTMPGRFTLSGFTPPRHWASADLGLVVSLFEKVSVFAGYTGRYGSESRLDHRANLGVGITF
ncbi:MAG: autotransporter domain-containing protein [Nitrospira sp. SB0672_bin_25]|nr:autotransporter domain-containing protein [Nitrospira sp. SB0666_bin_27]MYF23974.1 autotransporter domain-containing protein [Nitrospira sp. SB0678_bin_10]MYJ54735.1 autotransporter domain-containing protein [Nitrospira sp. SB0672_bin_25]